MMTCIELSWHSHALALCFVRSLFTGKVIDARRDGEAVIYHREPQVRKSGVIDGGVRSLVLGGEW
jgi:hypothetical protein